MASSMHYDLYRSSPKTFLNELVEVFVSSLKILSDLYFDDMRQTFYFPTEEITPMKIADSDSVWIIQSNKGIVSEKRCFSFDLTNSIPITSIALRWRQKL